MTSAGIGCVAVQQHCPASVGSARCVSVTTRGLRRPGRQWQHPRHGPEAEIKLPAVSTKRHPNAARGAGRAPSGLSCAERPMRRREAGGQLHDDGPKQCSARACGAEQLMQLAMFTPVPQCWRADAWRARRQVPASNISQPGFRGRKQHQSRLTRIPSPSSFIHHPRTRRIS